jgi:hypothetical protein
MFTEKQTENKFNLLNTPTHSISDKYSVTNESLELDDYEFLSKLEPSSKDQVEEINKISINKHTEHIVIPTILKVPNVPIIPTSIPNIPKIPTIPHIPSVPLIPGIPGVPSIPSLKPLQPNNSQPKVLSNVLH